MIEGAAALEHRRHRARSDIRLRQRVRIAAGRDGARRVLDPGRADARGSARSRRQASRPDRLRPRASRSHGRRRRCSCTIWASRRRGAASSSASPSHLLYADPALRPSPDELLPRRRGPRGALGARHLGRPADRARADRRDRGRSRHRAPAAARVRVLAHEAARRRSRDPERARAHPTCRTCRSRSKTLVRTSQSRPQLRSGRRARRGFCAARRSHFAGDARPCSSPLRASC